MYEQLVGKVVQLSPQHAPTVAVIEVGGMGYRIQVPLETGLALGGRGIGGVATLLLHHTVNMQDGEQRLFGFQNAEQRLLFRKLISVQGIGPSKAVQMMSVAGCKSLVQAIAAGDVIGLQNFKGVGEKLAERIVTELKDSLQIEFEDGGQEKGKGTQVGKGYPVGSTEADVLLALMNLDFKRDECVKAIEKAKAGPKKDLGVEDLLRAALRALNRF